MAIVKEATQFAYNEFGVPWVYLNNLAIPEVGPRFFLFWASRIIWNTNGYIQRVYVRDGGVGGTEYDLTLRAQTPDNVNPKLYLWYGELPNLSAGSDFLVYFVGGSDRRWIFGGYNLTGVDQGALTPALAYTWSGYPGAQTGDSEVIALTVPAGPGPGTLFDFPGGLRSGFGVKPDYVPQTAGLTEDYDSPPFPGSTFYGQAAGSKEVSALVPTEVSWRVSDSPDTFTTHAGIWVPTDVVPDPVEEEITLRSSIEESLTLRVRGD